jgi:hypothetical protein
MYLENVHRAMEGLFERDLVCADKKLMPDMNFKKYWASKK